MTFVPIVFLPDSPYFLFSKGKNPNKNAVCLRKSPRYKDGIGLSRLKKLYIHAIREKKCPYR